MKVFAPEYFNTGEHMDAERVNSSVYGVKAAAEKASELRMWRSFFGFQFDGVTTGSTQADRERTLLLPWTLEITAMQLGCYAAVGVTVTVDIIKNGGEVVSISTEGKGATEWASFERAVSARVFGNNTVRVSVDTGTADVQLHVHYRYVRTEVQATYPRVVEGEAILEPANNHFQTNLDAADGSVLADVATMVADTASPRIIVVDGPAGSTFGQDATVHIPDIGLKVVQVTAGASGSVTGVLDIELEDEGGGTIASLATTVGTGISLSQSSGTLSDQMPGSDITDAANDYKVTFSISSGSPTVTQSYAVLYLE